MGALKVFGEEPILNTDGFPALEKMD